MPLFTGIDCSLNHGACVTLDEQGEVHSTFRFSTSKQEVEGDFSGTRLKLPKGLDPHALALYRLGWIRDKVAGYLIYVAGGTERRDAYVAIEDYAYNKTFQAHQLGEIGGLLRSYLFDCGYNLRFHEPGAVKVFATGLYTADKDQMAAAFAQLQPAPKNITKLQRTPKGELFDAYTDIVDAYYLAALAYTEYELRRGALALSQLPAHKIAIFNRATKSYPVNVLARPWISVDRDLQSSIHKGTK